VRLIETAAQLAEAVEAVSRDKWVGVDTEADSLHHYVEKLCLVQVTGESGDWVFDPLAPLDLTPLVRVLEKKSLIFHGADFDIRILKKFYGFSPLQMFDTMIAAQILGYQKQGLADLTERHCGIRLSKSEQKADWSIRPLTKKMLDYASNDTHFLNTVRLELQKELAAKGRTVWHEETCSKLIQTATAEREPVPVNAAPWQIKGASDLAPKALTMLRQLWLWREEEARRRDWPSFKVLGSDYLIEIARWADSHAGEDIASWPEAPRNVRGRDHDAIQTVLKEASLMPASVYKRKPKPKLQSPKRWGNQEKKIFEALKAERNALASENGIHPSLLATNAVLEILTLEKPKTREAIIALECLLSWQIDLGGDRFLKAMRS